MTEQPVSRAEAIKPEDLLHEIKVHFTEAEYKEILRNPPHPLATLGDSAWKLIVATTLFDRDPAHAEAHLQMYSSGSVQNLIAQKIGLTDEIKMSLPRSRAIGNRHPHEALEALIGGIWDKERVLPQELIISLVDSVEAEVQARSRNENENFVKDWVPDAEVVYKTSKDETVVELVNPDGKVLLTTTVRGPKNKTDTDERAFRDLRQQIVALSKATTSTKIQ